MQDTKLYGTGYLRNSRSVQSFKPDRSGNILISEVNRSIREAQEQLDRRQMDHERRKDKSHNYIPPRMTRASSAIGLKTSQIENRKSAHFGPDPHEEIPSMNDSIDGASGGAAMRQATAKEAFSKRQ